MGSDQSDTNTVHMEVLTVEYNGHQGGKAAAPGHHVVKIMCLLLSYAQTWTLFFAVALLH